LDFNKGSGTSGITTIITFIIIGQSRVSTRPITELPEVFHTRLKWRATIDATCLIKIKILVFVSVTRDFTVFLAIDGIVDERINTGRQAGAIVVENGGACTLIVTEITVILTPIFMWEVAGISTSSIKI